MLPLLQRLTNCDEPKPSLMAFIKQDLEGLLNSISWFEQSDQPQLEQAITHVGLSRDTLNSYYGEAGVNRICHAIADMIANYEPRLKNVIVEPVAEEASLQLHLRITAKLQSSNDRDDVVFESYLNPVNMSFRLL